MVKEGNPKAKIVQNLLDDREHLIGAILLGNNLVNNLSTVLVTSMLLAAFGNTAGMVYTTIGMTFLVLIFAEVLPKTYAIKNHNSMALSVAPAMRIIVFIFTPITNIVYTIVGFILRVCGMPLANVNPDVTEEILRGAIDMHGREELDDDHSEHRSERHMLGAVLNLADLNVSDVMVHRQNMTVMDVNQSADSFLQEILNSPFTRIPIYQDDSENIIGIVHAKDILRILAERKEHHKPLDQLDVMSIALDPWFVPETTPLTTQLTAFRERKQHFSLVIDEYGALMGLITLEDIIEEIVGDINDEFDEKNVVYEILENGDIMVDGDTPIRDLNRAFDWELSDDHATTIAGMLIYEIRVIPTKGQMFNFQEFTFTIIDGEPTRITKIKIHPPHA